MRNLRHIVIALGVFVWSAAAAQPNDEAWYRQILKAVALQQAGNTADAEAAYQIALSRAAEIGPDSEQVAITLNNMGHFSHRLGRHLEAENQLLRALALMEAQVGAVGATYRVVVNIAGLYVETGQDTKAEHMLRRFLPADIRAVRDPDLAALTGVFGTLHARRHEYDEAERCYRHAIGVLDSRPQLLFQEYTAVLLSNLSDLYRNVGRNDDAFASSQRALAILDSYPGVAPAATLAVLNNAASVLTLSGSPEKAEPLFRRAVAVGENSFGSDSEALVAVFTNYKQCLLGLKRAGEAKSIEKRARTIVAKHQREIAMRPTVELRSLIQENRARGR